VERVLHIDQGLGPSLEQLNNVVVRWLNDVDNVGKNSAPFCKVRAMMWCPKKADSYSAGLNTSEMGEATLSRYAQRPLCDQTAKTVNDENDLAVVLECSSDNSLKLKNHYPLQVNFGIGNDPLVSIKRSLTDSKPPACHALEFVCLSELN
jgi:hypothetical protein